MDKKIRNFKFGNYFKKIITETGSEDWERTFFPVRDYLTLVRKVIEFKLVK